MLIKPDKYKNTTEIVNLNGVPVYLPTLAEAAIRGRLNMFLLGKSGFGKTQLVRDVMNYFGDRALFVLGRNDMDTRELFQQVNPEFLKALKEGKSLEGKTLKEVTDKVNYNLIAVDELPNCVPAVRAQLFNLFDGFIEINGKPYPIGNGYSIGLSTGNLGQEFTESSNELGRALKERMHLTLDVDFLRPQTIDFYDMLEDNLDPRVNFPDKSLEDRIEEIKKAYQKLKGRPVPFEKKVIGLYLVDGLDCLADDKRKSELKSSWHTKVEGHEAGSDVALIEGVSPRALKSIITLSQALDEITEEQGAKDLNYFESMMTAFKFCSAYSGVLNDALVRQTYDENPYKAMDAVIDTTREQFKAKEEYLRAGLEMARRGEKKKKISDNFKGRWKFMKDLLENLADRTLLEKRAHGKKD
ncbi:AAA family ATPase [Candidatus Woesearchaeota archaeon]|nr:AAA family ATPase [Candidatus Woesearchaeota archaeon]